MIICTSAMLCPYLFSCTYSLGVGVFFFQSLCRCVPEQEGICSSSSAYSLTGTDTLAQCTCVAGDWRAVKQREYLGCGCVIPVSNLLLLSHGGIDVDLHGYVSHVQNYP